MSSSSLTVKISIELSETAEAACSAKIWDVIPNLDFTPTYMGTSFTLKLMQYLVYYR